MSFTDAAAATQALESVVATAVEDETTRVPGLSFIVVAKDGSKLFHHSAGTRGVGIAPPQPVTDDSVFWIASCTKAVTAIACMQLVEQGVLSLDDSEQLETLLPELKNLQVLKEDGTTEPKQKGITLRMLLTHTAGFGYSFFNERLRDWGYPAGLDEFSGDFEDIKQPLLFQPGERWEYGVNLDWAGLALERATKTRLNDYMQKNIFQPLGLENINMFPTPSMKERLVHLHQRGADGKLTRRDHLHRRALAVESKEAKDLIFHSGGAGLFATTADYGRIISVLLNDGTCPVTGATILSRETVDQMFTNQIPQLPEFGRQGIPAAKPTHSNPIPELYPNDGAPQGWGLSFMITGGATGRSEGTGWWAGLANLYWWADREKGIGGIMASQVLPFADLRTIGTWIGLEKTVYDALVQ